MQTLTQNQVQVDDLTLEYFEAGSPVRPAVLILHGIIGHGREWHILTRSLAEEFRVVSLDQRGHGRSERADKYTVEAMADDVIQTVERLGLAPVRLVGHSMGGMAALVAAARRPELVEKLVTIDIGPDSVTPETGQMLAEWIRHLSAQRYASVDEAVAEWLEGDVFAREPLMRNYVEHNLAEREDGLAWMFDPEVARFPLDGVSREVLWQAVDSIRQPALVVRGAHSEHFTAEAAHALLDRLADGQLVEIPEGAHDLGVENQAAVAEAVHSFLP